MRSNQLRPEQVRRCRWRLQILPTRHYKPRRGLGSSVTRPFARQTSMLSTLRARLDQSLSQEKRRSETFHCGLYFDGEVQLNTRIQKKVVTACCIRSREKSNTPFPYHVCVLPYTLLHLWWGWWRRRRRCCARRSPGSCSCCRRSHCWAIKCILYVWDDFFEQDAVPK